MAAPVTDPQFTALMPMKAHSERVPGKNMREFCGRPLFHWMLEVLTECPYVKDVVINTDSEEIADSARGEFGATILERPEHLLGDMIGIQPLIEYDLSQTEGDLYLQTHSTNPLVRLETVNRAIETFIEDGMQNSLFTVTALQTRFYWPDGRAVNHDPELVIRTQDLEPVMEENSCLYVFTRQMFDQFGHRISRTPLMLEMDRFEAVDIDEEFDFSVAEALMNGRIAASEAPGT